MIYKVTKCPQNTQMSIITNRRRATDCMIFLSINNLTIGLSIYRYNIWRRPEHNLATSPTCPSLVSTVTSLDSQSSLSYKCCWRDDYQQIPRYSSKWTILSMVIGISLWLIIRAVIHITFTWKIWSIIFKDWIVKTMIWALG